MSHSHSAWDELSKEFSKAVQEQLQRGGRKSAFTSPVTSPSTSPSRGRPRALSDPMEENVKEGKMQQKKKKKNHKEEKPIRLDETVIEYIKKRVELSTKHAADLVNLFIASGGKDGYIALDCFQYIAAKMGITAKMVPEGLFRYVVGSTKQRMSIYKFVDLVKILSGEDTEEKVRLCFYTYDVDMDGVISREDIFQHISNEIIGTDGNLSKEKALDVQFLANQYMKRMDVDRDGEVSYNDFSDACQKDKSVIEVLGRVAVSLDTDHAELKFT